MKFEEEKFRHTKKKIKKNNILSVNVYKIYCHIFSSLVSVSLFQKYKTFGTLSKKDYSERLIHN